MQSIYDMDARFAALEAKFAAQEAKIEELEKKLQDQIRKAKQYALGLTGGKINIEGGCGQKTHFISFPDKDFTYTSLNNYKINIKQINLECLAVFEDDIEKKFLLRQGMRFLKSGIPIKAIDAIEIIKSYGYEIVYEFPDREINIYEKTVSYINR